MGRIVKTFSLSADTANLLDKVPLRERSKIVDEILFRELSGLVTAKLDKKFFKQIMKEVLTENSFVFSGGSNVVKNTTMNQQEKANEAIQNIFAMRKTN